MNIVCKGDFPTVQEIESMGDPDSQLKPDKVEAMFSNGELLPPHLIGEIQQKIDECFINNLMKDEGPMDKFGSMSQAYTDTINTYKIEVLNTLSDWQTKYEKNNSELGVNLKGRAAYTLRYGPQGVAPHPLLTLSYITVLDSLLGRIPSCIMEVCDCLHLSNYLFVYLTRGRRTCITHPFDTMYQIGFAPTKPALHCETQGSYLHCIFNDARCTCH